MDIAPAVPPFDPELVAPLEEIRAARTIPHTRAEIPSVRETRAAQLPTDDQITRGGALTLEERAVPGPAGAPDVPLMIIRPAGATGTLAAVYYIHGGGMIMGSPRGIGSDPLLDWAAELNTAVISVDYRLAPENPHPAPVEDCYAGLAWVSDHAAELGIDPARIVVAGASAGGGLAAGVALMARDRQGPPLIGQLLSYPMLDDRNDTASTHQMVGLGIWDRTANELGWTCLLGDARGGPDVSPYAAPARATDLSGLPPAFITVGSAETFRDEDVAYAMRIWAAGGHAELHVWPGGFHAFDTMLPDTALARDHANARLSWLRRRLG